MAWQERRPREWRSRALGVGIIGLLLAALLAGCAEQKPQPTPQGAKGQGYYKVGTPYQVDAVWYYPRVNYRYDETGIASWYGPDFHGKYTANGEVYDMNDLTGAHPTLPMPSIVRVTNLENGRSIIVRINDRGPYLRGRIVDLSRRAAQLLGMIDKGTAKVRVEILAEESRQAALIAQQGDIPTAERIAAALPGAIPPAERIAMAVPMDQVAVEPLDPPPGILAAPDLHNGKAANRMAAPRATVAPSAPPAVGAASGAAGSPQETTATPPQPQVTVLPVPPTSIYVQVAAFTHYDYADRLRAELQQLGPTRVSQATIAGQPFFRVWMGPADSVPEADKLLDQVVRAGYHGARIVVE